jgi:hypothetical protein
MVIARAASPRHRGRLCRGLPVVGHRQIADLLQVPWQVQGAADGEVGLGHFGGVITSAASMIGSKVYR